MAIRNPALPPLYFSSNDGATAEEEHGSPSLQNFPPELLHACLARYADWGDLARLACVQSKWKDIVDDAAMFGGRDATWELSMCLLHGDDARRGNRGLRKNEALAVKYLIRMCGMEVDAIRQPQGPPLEEQRDVAALLQLAFCYLSGSGLPRPDPDVAIRCLTSVIDSPIRCLTSAIDSLRYHLGGDVLGEDPAREEVVREEGEYDDGDDLVVLH